MQKKYKECQSCAMPFDKDPQGGGTNADGSKSTMYCSLCFAKGEFTLPDIEASGMQKIVKENMKKMGVPDGLIEVITGGIPDLARWKK